MSINALIILISLGAIWGASFMFARIAVPEVGAYAFGGLRVGIAGLCLLPFLMNKRRIREFKENYKVLAIVGVVGTLLPFTLFAFATNYLNAGLTSVLNSFSPVLTGVISYLFFAGELSKRQLLGIFVGIIGIVVLVSHKFSGDLGGLLPVGAGLSACIGYAISTNVTKRYLKDIGSLTIASGSLMIAAIVSVPMIIVFYPVGITISTVSLLSLFASAVLSTAFAIVLFNILIKLTSPLISSLVTFIIPIFAILFGMIFLDEKITVNIVIGTIIVLVSAVLFLRLPKGKIKPIKDF